MPNPNISTQDWFYHAPMKQGHTTPKQAPAPSQIPGMGGTADTNVPAESDDRHFRRKWIKETDSPYVQLAKRGGQKNLLSFCSPPTVKSEPVPYPRVEWFDHEHPDNEEELNESGHKAGHDHGSTSQKSAHRVIPDWLVYDIPSDDTKCVTENYRSRRSIMAYDNFSKWERDAKELTDTHRGLKLPPVQRPHRKDKRCGEPMAAQNSDPPAQRKRVSLPKIDKEPVNFMHLLAMQYQRDWLDEQQSKALNKRQEKKKQLKESEEKRDAQIKNTVAMRKPRNAAESNVPLFKLSRFKNVPPMVKTFRT